MLVGQDIGDGSDKDMKPRTIPGRKSGKESFGLYDLETQCLESLSTVELDTSGKRKHLETVSFCQNDLETDAFGDYSTVESKAEVVTVNAKVLDECYLHGRARVRTAELSDLRTDTTEAANYSSQTNQTNPVQITPNATEGATEDVSRQLCGIPITKRRDYTKRSSLPS